MDSLDLSDSQRALLQRIRVSRRLSSQPGYRRARQDASISSPLRREIIGEKGYDRASLQEICAAAGMLPGSLYYHFKSKEDLFVTVHAEGFRQLNEAVDAAIGGRGRPVDEAGSRLRGAPDLAGRAARMSRWSRRPACSTRRMRRCSVA